MVVHWWRDVLVRHHKLRVWLWRWLGLLAHAERGGAERGALHRRALHRRAAETRALHRARDHALTEVRGDADLWRDREGRLGPCRAHGGGFCAVKLFAYLEPRVRPGVGSPDLGVVLEVEDGDDHQEQEVSEYYGEGAT